MSESPKAKSNNPLPPVSRSKFFFDDSMIHIEIENVQFKVHKSKLIKSETFADMFVVADSSNNGDTTIEGSSTDHPIKLEGVSSSDFECLLTFLYEGHLKGKQANRDLSLLVPAFRLAHMWSFTELRVTLLPILERSLDDIDKIVYAREFGIEGWITPAYVKLYRREEPLSTEEAEKIGFKSAMLIFRLREERYSAAYQQCCGQTPKVESMTVNLQTRCDSCGNRRSMNNNATDKAIEERISTWEKGGQVFTK
ncbi:unnamed protein product [Rhizoctonia solani]|uniref:BTB domain-containing protein n=1 Tax=Rhizoctonia solani TaxID=456999 RepID=A0A8H3AJA6_9AGAM|nr:unnamed protein product [Rhizoctonia solani]CAE6522312.1 unnamed protein product [Rhizoctonia solani]